MGPDNCKDIGIDFPFDKGKLADIVDIAGTADKGIEGTDFYKTQRSLPSKNLFDFNGSFFIR